MDDLDLSTPVRARTFEALKPITTQIVPNRDNPKKLASVLESLRDAIQSQHTEGVLLCLEYLLFPLMMIVESGCAVRTEGPADDPKARLPSNLPLPAASADKVFETALSCVLTLVDKAGVRAFHDPELLLTFVERWTPLLSMARPKVSEEPVEMSAKVIRLAFQSAITSKESAEKLGQEAQAALVGHLLSSLLRCAETELKLGPKGSRSLTKTCVEAVTSVVTLLASDAESLAFFVPGLVHGLSSVILTGTGSATSDKGELSMPAGGATLTSAFAALSSILVITLSDSSLKTDTVAELDRRIRAQDPASTSSSSPTDPAQIMAALKDLALHGPDASSATASSAQETAAKPRPPPPRDRLRVLRDADWIEMTSDRASLLLRLVILRLISHPSPSARAALARGLLAILQGCTKSLGAVQACSKIMVEALLTLAQDEVADVSSICRDVLAKAVQADGSALTPHLEVAASHALSSWLQLPSMLRQSSVENSLQFVCKTAAAVEALGPERTIRDLLSDPLTADKVVSTLLRAFTFNQEEAGLMLHALGPATYYSNASASSAASLAAIKLPRLPLGLRFVSQPRLYEAVARLPRLLGRAAILTEARASGPLTTPSPFTALVNNLVAEFRRLATHATKKKNGATAKGKDASWQLQAASVLVILQEVIFGASSQWTGFVLSPSSADAVPSAWDLANDEPLHPALAPISSAPPAQQNPPSSSAFPQDDDDEFGLPPPPFTGLEDLMREDESEAFLVPSFMRAEHDEPPLPAPAPSTPPSSAPGLAQPLLQPQSPDKLLITAVQHVQQELFQGRSARAIWALDTALQEDDSPTSSPSSSADRLTLQQLGENATLMRALLESVGVFATAVGPPFAKNAKLLAPALMPVLTRTTDGSLSVRASAEASVSALVSRCGFLDLSDLIRKNGDWIVDDICRQLRGLDAHPRAPQLLSALLCQAKVAADLLPLMAEPLRLSLSGISLLTRSKQPQHTQAFARSLRELSKGLHDEGGRLLAASTQRFTTRDQVLETAGVDSAPSTSDEASAKEEEGPASLSQIGSFFSQKRAEGKKRRQDASLEDDPDSYQAQEGAGQEGSYATRELPPGLEASLWSDLDAEERRYLAAGSIAVSLVENIAPLITSPDLVTALLALETAIESLRGLQGAADTVKLNAGFCKAVGLRPRPLRASQGEPPKLLPSVHHLWPFLMAALRDFRLPVVSAALTALPRLCHLAGADFMTRRLTIEAWPVLTRLLQGGRPILSSSAPPVSRPVKTATSIPAFLTSSRDAVDSQSLTEHAQIASGALKVLGASAPTNMASVAVEDIAPGAQLQLRTAVLASLEALATPSGTEREVQRVLARRPGQESVRLAVGDMMEAIVPFLGKAQPLAIQEQATRAFQALIPHDDNAAWLLLTDIIQAGTGKGGQVTAHLQPPSLPAELERAVQDHLASVRAATDPQSATRGPMTVRVPAATLSAGRARVFPSVSVLLPPFESAGVRDQGYAGVIEASRLAQCAPRAAKLLAGTSRTAAGTGSRPKWTSRVLLPRAPELFGNVTLPDDE